MVIRSKSCFGKALKFAKESSHGLDSSTPEALRLIEGQWKHGNFSDSIVAQINHTTKNAFDQVHQKLAKDWESVRSLPISDNKVVPWTNRRIESAFAYLKTVDKKFSTMIASNVHMIAVSKMNHLASWIQSNSQVASTSSARASYYELRRKREAEFTLEAAIEEFSALAD